MSNCKIIAIGASTGGTTALEQVLLGLPTTDLPCILVVQHMPAGFTKTFADRLNSVLKFDVREAKNGDDILPGRIYIAPGGYHLEMIKVGNRSTLTCTNHPPIKGLRPTVAYLFKSVAKYEASNAIAVMLTGMGDDGAEAMLELRNKGARTIGQDKATSIVYGMPKKAYEIGAIEKVLPLHRIANGIMHFVKTM